MKRLGSYSLVSVSILGSLALLDGPARAQAPPQPPPPGLPASDPAVAREVLDSNLDGLIQQMTERVRKLEEAIDKDLGKTQAGPLLLQDVRELSLALDEFHMTVAGIQNALRGRQLYSGIDSSWHHLLGRLRRPGVSTSAVGAAARRVEEIDNRILKVLGMNAMPAVYYGDRASPGGMPEVQRLAHALVDRAEALLAYTRADLRGPAGSRVTQQVLSLWQRTDAFHDGLNLEGRVDDITRNGFAGVAAASDEVAAEFVNAPISDRIRSAWRSYKAAETLMRQALKLPIPQQADPGTGAITNNDLRTPALALADRLVVQTDDFLVAFTPEAKDVREGGYFIADARRLRAAASDFRDAIPRSIEVGQLAQAFREVDALWQILARRTNRIAQGRVGPNIQRIESIGQTVAEIHRMLGMPGYPAVVGPFGGPG